MSDAGAIIIGRDTDTQLDVVSMVETREVDLVINQRWSIRFLDPESLRRVIATLQEAHDKVERRRPNHPTQMLQDMHRLGITGDRRKDA